MLVLHEIGMETLCSVQCNQIAVDSVVLYTPDNEGQKVQNFKGNVRQCNAIEDIPGLAVTASTVLSALSCIAFVQIGSVRDP
jgi:hypothetical protein